MNNINHLFSILCCLIFLSIIYMLLNRIFKFQNYVENWQDYTINPLGDNNPIKDKFPYIDSGFNPLYLYLRNRYNKPYRYPFKFFKSYPMKHLSYLP